MTFDHSSIPFNLIPVMNLSSISPTCHLFSIMFSIFMVIGDHGYYGHHSHLYPHLPESHHRSLLKVSLLIRQTALPSQCLSLPNQNQKQSQIEI